MSTQSETSDSRLLELLRRKSAMSIVEMAEALEVTATAIRQRLTRLMGQGLIEREVNRVGRGRPSHRYRATAKARRQAGNNAADLALALWNEVRAVQDPAVRRGLLERLAGRMAELYKPQVSGGTLDARLAELQEVFNDRSVPLEVVEPRQAGVGPMLRVVECPYGELAEADRGVCAMERLLFSELLDTPLRLTECRLDGHDCCQFQTS